MKVLFFALFLAVLACIAIPVVHSEEGYYCEGRGTFKDPRTGTWYLCFGERSFGEPLDCNEGDYLDQADGICKQVVGTVMETVGGIEETVGGLIEESDDNNPEAEA